MSDDGEGKGGSGRVQLLQTLQQQRGMTKPDAIEDWTELSRMVGELNQGWQCP